MNRRNWLSSLVGLFALPWIARAKSAEVLVVQSIDWEVPTSGSGDDQDPVLTLNYQKCKMIVIGPCGGN